MRRDRGIRAWSVASLTASSAMLALAASLWFATQAQAQENTIIHPGSMAVTGFSGTVIPGNRVRPAARRRPRRRNLHRQRSAQPCTLRRSAPWRAAEWPARLHTAAFRGARPLGSASFSASAYDDGVRVDGSTSVPNLYAGATSLHGLRIVTPDEDGDGRPERQRRGKAGATFMDGQFAESNGGSPGAIWKVDGVSGAVSLFARIDGNSGPGLGDVRLRRGKPPVVRLRPDTGLNPHRVGADGTLIDTFDHGVAGRPTRGLAAVADDGTVMDIQGEEFDSEDPDSWGLTQDGRRVWAVKGAWRPRLLFGRQCRRNLVGRRQPRRRLRQ